MFIVVFITPVSKKIFTKPIPAGCLEKAGGNDLICIDVFNVERNGGAYYFIYRFHLDKVWEYGSMGVWEYGSMEDIIPLFTTIFQIRTLSYSIYILICY
jgi:hypothetical protein